MLREVSHQPASRELVGWLLTSCGKGCVIAGEISEEHVMILKALSFFLSIFIIKFLVSLPCPTTLSSFSSLLLYLRSQFFTHLSYKCL